MIHYYDVEVASQYGVNAAVILQNIYYWCLKNRANGRHLHDGRFWTYNTEEAFATLFPEFTKWQVRTAIKKLKDAGVILTGNYNSSTYDRTLWYTLTAYGESLMEAKPDNADCKNAISKLQICNMDVAEMQFGNSTDATPIPNINQITNVTDNKPDSGAGPTTRTPKTSRPAKSRYGEYGHVLLSDDEKDKLIAYFGEDDTEAAIRLLDEYLEETGKKYKNHYLTLRRWVFDALRERMAKSKTKQAARKPTNQDVDFDWDRIAEALESDG